MNINIFSRIQLSNRADISSKIDFDRNNTMVSRINGPSFKFNKIFKESDNVKTIHETCLSPLINGVINGFNTSLLLFGETGSGKSYMLAGNDNDRLGMFAASIQDLFSKLSTDERFHSTFKVYLRMFEVHDDVLVDLLKSNNSMKFSFDSLICTPGQGCEIKGISEVDVSSSAQAVVIFRDSWNRRILYSKNDPDLQLATIVQIKLFLKNFQDNSNDTVSQISFVYFPGDESLILSTSHINGERKCNGVFAVGRLLDELSDSSISYGNYNISSLTTLLEDELGGNCITHALLCLPSGPNPDILAAQLRTMNNLSKVKTYPVMNTVFARKLLYNLKLQRNELLHNIFKDVKLRSTVLNQKSMFEELKLTQKQNIEFRDKIEILQQRLEKLNNRYNHTVMDKSNLSEDFIQSEEEKLRASKRIMELEIENSKNQEMFETTKFELLNKIVHLEERLVNYELEKSLYKENSKSFTVIKEEKDQLSKQLLNLRKSYEDLQKEASHIVSKNKELNMEFINMLNTKKIAKTDIELNNAELLLDEDCEIGFFRFNQDRRPLSNISSQRDTTMKLRLGKLQEMMQKARETSQERLQEISKLSVNCIILKAENKQLNNRIQELTNTLHDITGEYQQRIKKYAMHLSSLLDTSSTNEKQYKEEIILMLKRYDSSRMLNENHLKNLVTDTRKQHDFLRGWSERIVYEYIKIRHQIITEGFSISEIGADPLSILEDYSLPKDYLKFMQAVNDKREISTIMELKQQIKEFSNSTQSALEIERAQLLARNAELEEEVVSSQNYIEMYLKQKSLKQKK